MIYLIMNPGSRSGRSQQSFDRIIKLMDQSHIDFKYRFTSSLDDALHLSRKANVNGYQTIVAVGGDGTINAVVNGFYDDKGHRISNSKFGVVYTGTSPDFNKSYNIPLGIDPAIEVILHGEDISIPVGMISFESNSMPAPAVQNSKPFVRYFVCCTNIGLGASLAQKANSGIRGKLGDFWGTLVSLVGLLLTFKSFTLNLEENNEVTHLERMTNLSVGITPYIASGIRVPFEPGSGKKGFYRMIVQNLNLFRVIPLLRKVYSGKPFENSCYLSLSCCRQVRLSSAVKVEVEADGDSVGYLPCSVRFAPDDLQLMAKGYI